MERFRVQLAVRASLAVGLLALTLSPAMTAGMADHSSPAMSGAGSMPTASASNISAQAFIFTDMASPPMNTTGSIQMHVIDATQMATADSQDTATVVARFRYPSNGPTYTVTFTCLTPTNAAANYYGGVAIDRPVFGPDNLIGVPLPRTTAHVAVFGKATLTKDGQTISEDQPAFALVTPALHDANSRLMTTPDNMRQEIHLFIPGSMMTGGRALPGFPKGYAYIYWPGAAYELQNVGGKVDVSEVVVSTPPTTGAGPTAPATMQPMLTGEPLGTISMSLTNSGIRKQIGEAPAGLYDVRVTNNSSRRMGVIYRGTDLCCTQYVRFSELLSPGESQTFRWFFAPGKVSIQTYYSATPVREGFRDVRYAPWSSSITFQQ